LNVDKSFASRERLQHHIFPGSASEQLSKSRKQNKKSIDFQTTQKYNASDPHTETKMPLCRTHLTAYKHDLTIFNLFISHTSMFCNNDMQLAHMSAQKYYLEMTVNKCSLVSMVQYYRSFWRRASQPSSLIGTKHPAFSTNHSMPIKLNITSRGWPKVEIQLSAVTKSRPKVTYHIRPKPYVPPKVKRDFRLKTETKSQ